MKVYERVEGKPDFLLADVTNARVPYLHERIKFQSGGGFSKEYEVEKILTSYLVGEVYFEIEVWVRGL
jgi:hypothetical protein